MKTQQNLEDDAEFYAENLSDIKYINFHLKGRSKVYIKEGVADELYISARGVGTSFDGGGLRAGKVWVNVSNGLVGKIIVNPQESFFKIGNSVATGLVSVNSKLQNPSVKNALKYKVNRFLGKSWSKIFNVIEVFYPGRHSVMLQYNEAASFLGIVSVCFLK